VIIDLSHLDVAGEALEVCARTLEECLGDEIDVPDDLDDSAMDGALFDLYASVRLSRAALARVRLLTMMADEGLPRPKKRKKDKRSA